ncbi:MAG: hypothetical protein JWM99_2873, partial [Verrucomicrobiales bacterium]|nr:hypothetical protein [Verrucomicrobiales bacterium]
MSGNQERKQFGSGEDSTHKQLGNKPDSGLRPFIIKFWLFYALLTSARA